MTSNIPFVSFLLSFLFNQMPTITPLTMQTLPRAAVIKCVPKSPQIFCLLKKLPPFNFHQCKFYSRQPLLLSSNDSLLHAKAIKNGSFQNLDVASYLLHLYGKSKCLSDARKVFDEMSQRDVRTWTILVSSFARAGSNGIVLELFRDMQNETVKPNQFTLSIVLKCCSSLSELRIGKGVHGWILRNGVVFDVVLGNSLLDFYVKCEDFGSAKWLFELMGERNSVSWNIMIGAHLNIGDVEKAVDIFRRLSSKDVASWNTIIDGLMRNGPKRMALELLYEMVKNGTVLDEVTFSISLVLVSSFMDIELGKQIHGRVLRLGFHVDGFIRASLIDMYCKCGKMEMALEVFKRMNSDFGRKENSIEEIVSWSSIVSGFVLNGEIEDAFKTFTSMISKEIEVDRFTVTSIVSACANSGVLELGQQVHALIQKIGHRVDAHLGSSLIDMYSKCGSLDDAQMVFKQTNDKNVVLWTSMISCCALHGQGREAVRLFEFMMSEGIKPNVVTFIGVLTACSHAGLIEEGCRYFRLMKEVYGIKPGVDHYSCMVDLYGRAGQLNETKNFIHENGIDHMSAVWRSFLSSCRLHRDIKMAEWVSEKLLHLEPPDAGTYILLSNIYATKQRWEEAAEVRSLMQSRGVKKHPGQSWIQIKNQDVEEEQGEMLLGFHSEKLATAYGIISMTSQKPIRIMKNLRVCNDCHTFMKYTSQLLDREIIVRDIRRFHHFKRGCCSCGDYW
ncbi:Pentatricopeptide repeat - like 10 [Theobroma cacao]|nr:Pentatricopeptide repeat - like 10 [Theobroma cacao]